MRRPSPLDLSTRRPVWAALSELFLDTRLRSQDLDRLARELAASPYSEEELDDILLKEVYPACHTNLYSIAGEWAGFDPEWLESRILRGFWLPRRIWAGTVGRLSVYSSLRWRSIKARVRAIRAEPSGGQRVGSSRSRRRRLSLFAGALLMVALGAGAWAFFWEPRRLVVREVDMPVPCWRGAPLRVALVSDLHIGSPGVGLPKLDTVTTQIQATQPDIVLLLGDFVIQGVTGGRFVPPETIAAKLGQVRARFGVYAVLGNHDWWLDAPRVRRAFEAAGIPVLEDAAVRVRTDGDAFWLAGISDFWEGKHDVGRAVASIADDAPVIAMTHNPDVFPSVPARVCLTLAGHTHGGQVNLPLLGRPIVPSRYGRRYAAGEVEENGRRLFVTTGVGTSIIPVRFRVPPEIVVLTVSSSR